MFESQYRFEDLLLVLHFQRFSSENLLKMGVDLEGDRFKRMRSTQIFSSMVTRLMNPGFRSRSMM